MIALLLLLLLTTTGAAVEERLVNAATDTTESVDVNPEVLLVVAQVFTLAGRLAVLAGTANSVCGINVPLDEARLRFGVGITKGDDRPPEPGTRPLWFLLVIVPIPEIIPVWPKLGLKTGNDD